MNRAKDWFIQSKHVLDHARWSLKGEFFDGVCFLSQQASELAVKAICFHLKEECWGHAISRLLTVLGREMNIPEEIVIKAKKLDKYYIPTRYPNGFEIGAPKEYFTEEEAKEAIKNAEEIIKFCGECLQE